jgi:hypothetical protein
MNIIPGEARRNQTDILERWMPVFPARTKRWHRYSTFVSIAGTSGAVATHVFSANGMFDPDITSTGHQPMGFDQLILSYNHYTVTRARITCTFRNNVATTPGVAIRLDGSSTPVTVATDFLEAGVINHTSLERSAVSGSIKTLELAVNIAKFEGVDDALDVVDLRGSSAANPAEQTYFHVLSWDPGAVTTSTIVEVLIDYEAVWTEPRVLTASLASQFSRLLRSEEKRSQ